MLGKRKRATQVVSRREQSAENDEGSATPLIDSYAIFRQHFEATFAPLPEQQPDKDRLQDEYDEDDSGTESEVSEWSGLSESDNDLPVVEVEEPALAEGGTGDQFHRARQKAFMVRLFRLTSLHAYTDSG